MKTGSRHSFLSPWLVLALAMLGGLHGPVQATDLPKLKGDRDTKNAPTAPNKEEKTSEKKQDAATTKTAPNTEENGLESDEEDTSAEDKLDKEEDSEPPQAPRLKKPKPLEPTKLAQEDSLAALDKLIVKQQVSLTPYVPLVQSIDIALDYGRLAMNLWTPQERRYAGSMAILWRKNIQLSGTWGYNQLRPSQVEGNQSDYTVNGQYGSWGLAYFTKYNLKSNLYAGLRYARSYFTNSTATASEEVISKDLTGSWWELVLGSEQQLFTSGGFHAGLVFHLKSLGSFKPFEPASNYVVPGYGRSVASIVPSITLYIKYQISFLEKQLSFSTPKAN